MEWCPVDRVYQCPVDYLTQTDAMLQGAEPQHQQSQRAEDSAVKKTDSMLGYQQKNHPITKSQSLHQRRELLKTGW